MPARDDGPGLALDVLREGCHVAREACEPFAAPQSSRWFALRPSAAMRPVSRPTRPAGAAARCSGVASRGRASSASGRCRRSVGDAGLDLWKCSAGFQEGTQAGVVALPVHGPSELSGVPVRIDRRQLLGTPRRAFGVLAEAFGPPKVGEPLPDRLVHGGGAARVPASRWYARAAARFCSNAASAVSQMMPSSSSFFARLAGMVPV